MLAKLMLKCKLKYAGNGIKAKITERIARGKDVKVSSSEY